ncbi:NAD(P)H-dependent oxidoreductase subunit E [Isosphaeraceae bacterium EP7]
MTVRVPPRYYGGAPASHSPREQTMIVQRLHEIQERCGYLPEAEMRALSAEIGEPLHRLHEVASFFPHYRLAPGPAARVLVCRDMACHLRGAAELETDLKGLANELGEAKLTVGKASCLGRCDHAPSVVINDKVYWDKSASELREMIRLAVVDPTQPPMQHASRVKPGWKIDPYDGEPRYEAARKLAQGGDVDAALEQMETSKLFGMGGAAFATTHKWKSVRKAPGAIKYVVCNGDESEPGTFKDRDLMRLAPHLVVEGVIIGALVIGARRGTIYIRHEYEEEIAAVKAAVEAARAMGALGPDIFGTGRAMEIDVFVSPGGYICGEESALLEAMEDRRAEPRNKPPFPMYTGLYGKPTLINNVETLSWVPSILLNGGAWYRDQGIGGGTGLRFFSIAGDVERPGVYEIPTGTTLRRLVFDHAGGMRGGQALRAVAFSGPSGGLTPARVKVENVGRRWSKDHPPGDDGTYDVLDLPLEPESFRAIGTMLGAAITIIGAEANLLDFALSCLRFYRDESCGKCVPCRVGSQKLVDLAESLARGNFPRSGLGLVDELSRAMVLTSICGLGMVAPSPLTSLIKHFPEAVEPYLAPAR